MEISRNKSCNTKQILDLDYKFDLLYLKISRKSSWNICTQHTHQFIPARLTLLYDIPQQFIKILFQAFLLPYLFYNKLKPQIKLIPPESKVSRKPVYASLTVPLGAVTESIISKKGLLRAQTVLFQKQLFQLKKHLGFHETLYKRTEMSA